jgi:hypothetical protein
MDPRWIAEIGRKGIGLDPPTIEKLIDLAHERKHPTGTYLARGDGTMLKQTLIAVSSSLLFVVAACASHSDGGGDPSGGTTGDDQNVKSKGAGEGATCGGSSGIKCAAGLECEVEEGGAPVMGMPIAKSGKCVKSGGGGAGAGEGENCGGLVGIKCKAGLTCVTSGECCDLPGKCEHAPVLGMPIRP